MLAGASRHHRSRAYIRGGVYGSAFRQNMAFQTLPKRLARYGWGQAGLRKLHRTAKPPSPCLRQRSDVRRRYAHSMHGRFATLTFAALVLFVGCAAGDRVSPVNPTSSRTPSLEDLPARIEAHFDRLEAQASRVARLELRAHRAGSFPQPTSPDLRARITAYRQAERQQRALFAVHRIALDAEYFRLQHQLLDAFSAGLHQIEQFRTSK